VAEILPYSHVFAIGDDVRDDEGDAAADAAILASDEVLPPLVPVDDRRRALLRLAHDNTRAHAREALS